MAIDQNFTWRTTDVQTSVRSVRRSLRVILLAATASAAMLAAGVSQAQLQNNGEWPKTNFEKISVDPATIFSGGPPRDGIPAVDNPKYVSIADADGWLDNREPVVSLEINGKARAYPIQILMWHEIANDELGGEPVSVTFCPLCNAAIVFDRRVKGQILDFGTTGRLRKSDMVMFDRQTESWWQQFTGTAIVGDMLDVELRKVPATIVAWETFKSVHPDGDVLSRDTGHQRQYGMNPYQGYDSLDQPFLFTDPVDKRLPAMEYVLNVSFDDSHRLYPLSALKPTPVLNDEFAGRKLVVLSRDGMARALDKGEIKSSGSIQSAAAFERVVDGKELTFDFKDGKIVDRETGSEWDSLGHATSGAMAGKSLPPTDGGVHFAFAWLAFVPDSDIYKP